MGGALPSRSVTVRGAEMRLPKSSVEDTAVSDILIRRNNDRIFVSLNVLFQCVIVLNNTIKWYCL